MEEPSKSIEDINVDLFDLDQFVADYDTHKGWNDIGEMKVLVSLAPALRGKPVLDVGMGTGRTTPLLALLADDYGGIDYAPSMVREAEAALPGFDLRVGDVRNLRADFGDGPRRWCSSRRAGKHGKRGRLGRLSRLLDPQPGKPSQCAGPTAGSSGLCRCRRS